MRLILGSKSPRRAEILNFFSLDFIQIKPEFNEKNITTIKKPDEFTQTIAEKKAISIQKKYSDSPILTADTIVYFQEKIFTKPKNAGEAFAMLNELCGHCHEVYTGVCVKYKNSCYLDFEISKVYFHKLSAEMIRKYHKNLAHLDKAGAYAIQKSGSIIVKRIEGCYYNIMGLPINTTGKLLYKIGIDLWDYL